MKVLRVLFILLFVFISPSCRKDIQESKTENSLACFESLLKTDEVINITLWHYYNSAQKEKFDKLVNIFNAGIGSKYGVHVKSIRRSGNLSEIAQFIADSIEKKVGADAAPDIFSAYPDTAFELNKKGLLVDIGCYLTDSEKAEYVQDFLYASGFGKPDEIKLFPIAKATEVLVINKTAWLPFAKTNGLSYEALTTWENLSKTAELYYKWTDNLTDEPNDGKPFFGRDSISNYMIVGTYELGNEVFNISNEGNATFKLDKKMFRTCWDNYYVPFIKGHFSAKGKFRSDDLRTGDIIACVTSTSSAIYLPYEVIDSAGNTQKIDLDILPIPHFKNAKLKTAVQQGAGMAILKSDTKRELASVLFLKWFTGIFENTEFAIETGYLPVKDRALTKENIDNAILLNNKNISPKIKNSILTSINTVKSCKLYFQPGFIKSHSARAVLSNSIKDKALADRKKIEENIKKGASYQNAISEFLTDENFEMWFNNIKSQLADL